MVSRENTVWILKLTDEENLLIGESNNSEQDLGESMLKQLTLTHTPSHLSVGGFFFYAELHKDVINATLNA